MFREMRRKKQQMSFEQCVEVLERRTAGVLAVSGDDDYPYAVPLSYVYCDSKIIFHCAKSGHKLDAIAKNDKVSFCVIDADEIVPLEFTTYFRSVIAFGKARILDDEAEKRKAIEVLAEKYTPDHLEERNKEIDGAMMRLCMVEISIDYMTGKEAKELIQAKQK